MSAIGSEGVLARLRALILNGRYPAGGRVSEVAIANDLGVSRTPVRLAFRTLEQEGLLVRKGKRKLVVRALSEDDIRCAVEVRGTLEGLAARRLVERRRVTPGLLAVLTQCIDDGEAMLAKGWLEPADATEWGRLNAVFHGAILDAQESTVIADAIRRNDHLPFASAGSIAINADALDREYERLRVAQLQHRLIVDALERGEGTRADNLMREHALVGIRYATMIGLARRVADADVQRDG